MPLAEPFDQLARTSTFDRSEDAMTPIGTGSARPAAKLRYRVLDTYRFFAASGIVLYHFEAHFRPFMPNHVPRLERLQCLVDFFFVLSGFVLMHTYGRGPLTWAAHKDFLWKRFARLYPLHLATLAFCCLEGALVLALGLKVRDPSFFDVSLIPSNLLLIQAWGVNDHPGLNSPSWSLSAEAFVYILFPVLVGLLSQIGAWKGIAVAITIAATTALVRDRCGWGDASVATYDLGNLRALPSFLIGMATCSIVDRMPARRIGWALPSALGVGVVAMMLLDVPAYVILGAFPVLVGAIAMAERGGSRSALASPFFVMLGNASFAIYMTHSFFQATSVGVIRKLGWTSPLGLLAGGTACFVVIVGAGVLSYLLFEVPARRMLLRLGTSRAPVAETNDPLARSRADAIPALPPATRWSWRGRRVLPLP